jgi:hypothetical protein
VGFVASGDQTVISTRDLRALPDIDTLRRLMQSLAVLDAVLSPEWEYRLFSFNSKWSKGEQMGSMRNGQGDDLFANFTKVGCLLKGFAHEYPMTPYRVQPKQMWPGVLDSVPKAFAKSLREPAFSMDDTTFCVWRLYGDQVWSCGDIKFPPKHPDPDGSGWLLSYYDGKSATYRKYAYEYFDANVPLKFVKAVYAHEPLTEEVVQAINPEVSLADLKADLKEIGYPSPAVD